MLIKRVKGKDVKITNAEAKRVIMEAHGFTTTEQYNKYYDIRRNKQRAYENFLKAEGVDVKSSSVVELLYKEALSMKRYGAEYQPSQKSRLIQSFPSISSGIKIRGPKAREHGMSTYQTATYERFEGLILANAKAKEIYFALMDHPIKQQRAMVDFANKLHAELGYNKSGEAIPSGEVYGSDSYDNFDIDIYLK